LPRELGALPAGRAAVEPGRRVGRLLNGARDSAPGAPMEKILRAAVERGASDLHIKAGDVFRARIDGRLVPLTRQALTADQTRSIALGLLPTEADRARIDDVT